jgi:hypothetical protein
MSFNPTFNYTPARQLILPSNGTEGWKTLGTIYNGVAGYMSWKDKQKQAERMQKAQDDYYELLKSYLNRNEEAPVEEPVVEEAVVEEPAYTFTPTLPTRASNDEERMALENRMAKQASEDEALDNYQKALAAAKMRSAAGLIGGM